MVRSAPGFWKKNRLVQDGLLKIRLVIKLLKIKKKWHVWSLLVLSLVLLVSHTLYVLKTHQYPEVDEHVYMGLAVKFYDILKHLNVHSWYDILNVNPNRQPFYGLILAIPLLLFGTDYTYKIALGINGIFYVVTIIAIYYLGKEFISKKSSVLASVIFAFYGFPLFYLHFTYSETATSCFVVLSLLFLAKSHNFSIPKHTFFFSLLLTAGNLTRWVSPLFIFGSLIVTLFFSIRNQFRKKTRYAKSFLISLIIIFLIGILPSLLVYYIPNFLYFKQYVNNDLSSIHHAVWAYKYAPFSDLINVFSTHSIMFYINIFSQQTIYFIALFAVGLILSIIFIRRYAFLSLGFLLAYFFFTFGSVEKGDRYIVPIYPLMAIISAIVFDYVKNKKIEFVLIIATVIIGFLNFLGSSWGIGPMGQQGLKDIVLPEFIRHPRRIYLTPMVWPPREEELNAELIINTIEQDFGRKSRPPALLSTFDYHPFDNAIYSIAFYHKRYLLKAPDLNIRHIAKDDYFRLFGDLKTADYVIVKESNPIDKYGIDSEDMYIVKQFNKALRLPNGKLPNAFVPIKIVLIPMDKSHVTIYKKTRDITNQEMNDFAELFIKLNPQEKEIIRKAILEYEL